ncbi:PAAR domain-containing protein [Pseudomonas sp. NPDC089406]|uniref:PAAR domain-containing protein n=1 Tax=Pseudomonas sp. NPDC089406 TaxID=3364463 RepID=UPI00384FD729
MSRVEIAGVGQALDGDATTTGAVCIASEGTRRGDGRAVLRMGDSTTECPRCKQVGTVAEGIAWFISQGREVAFDGALVACGCPLGSNRVVAPLGSMPAPRSAPVAAASSFSAPTRSPLASPAPGAVLEPGFHIVRRSMSGPQVLAELLAHDHRLPMARLQRLNPTFEKGFKAGEIFVLGDPDNHHACTREEADLMAAAQRAREALAGLDEQEANFMMEHIGEIAGVLSGASQSMGVGKDMLSRGLGQVADTLKGIEQLHQREFGLHGHLKSPQFFASRQALYQQLDAQLRSAFLGKYLNLGGHESLRKGLGISTKSLVHHWSKAGAPGAIPGYATHLDEVAKMARYLKYGGHVAVGLGATSSYMKVQEACRAGETEECRRVRFTETGSFTGGLAGGLFGGTVGNFAIKAFCSFGPWGRATCGILVIGASSFGGSKVGAFLGESGGEMLYEVAYD